CHLRATSKFNAYLETDDTCLDALNINRTAAILDDFKRRQMYAVKQYPLIERRAGRFLLRSRRCGRSSCRPDRCRRLGHSPHLVAKSPDRPQAKKYEHHDGSNTDIDFVHKESVPSRR